VHLCSVHCALCCCCRTPVPAGRRCVEPQKRSRPRAGRVAPPRRLPTAALRDCAEPAARCPVLAARALDHLRLAAARVIATAACTGFGGLVGNCWEVRALGLLGYFLDAEPCVETGREASGCEVWAKMLSTNVFYCYLLFYNVYIAYTCIYIEFEFFLLKIMGILGTLELRWARP